MHGNVVYALDTEVYMKINFWCESLKQQMKLDSV